VRHVRQQNLVGTATPLDLLVSERVDFTIVRKLPGLPARLAFASDPRRTGESV